MKDLHASACCHCVCRVIMRYLPAQQMPLNRQDAFGLSDLAFGARTGMVHRRADVALRRSEQNEHQYDEKPDKSCRAPRCKVFYSTVFAESSYHPWAAHT